MKPPFIINYVDIKQRGVDITKAKQLIEGICTHRGIQPICTFQNTFRQQRQCQPFFSRGGQNQTQQRNNVPQYNSNNAPRLLCPRTILEQFISFCPPLSSNLYYPFYLIPLVSIYFWSFLRHSASFPDVPDSLLGNPDMWLYSLIHFDF